MSENKQRICLVVLGMHRSGTSALARTLALLGADLPTHLVAPGHGNESGHWEPAPLVELHDRMLVEAGSGWDDWRAFDIAGLSDDRVRTYRDEIATCLTEEYGESRLFVLKDPRMARFVPLYAETLAAMQVEARYVVCHRSPAAAIASLSSRNELPPASATLLWLRHVLDAETQTRASARAIVSYEGLLTDWRGTVGIIAESLQLTWPRTLGEVGASIDAFLRPELQHHGDASASTEGALPASGWVEAVDTSVRDLISDPSNPHALAALDRVRGEFDPMARLFGSATLPELYRRDRVIADINQALDALHKSKSWRITWPLRQGSQLIGRFRARVGNSFRGGKSDVAGGLSRGARVGSGK